MVGSQKIQKAWKCLIVNDTLQEGEIIMMNTETFRLSGIKNVNMVQQCGKIILKIHFNDEIGKEFLSSKLTINTTNYTNHLKLA